MRSKKKLLTTATALTTAAAMLLGGTFAWQSISQSALNESTDTINPGGRLHNDIAAVENDPNATYNFIYVENFSGDEDDDGTVTGGEDIFARIRLEEYMELVMNYGVDGMEIVKNIAGAKTLKDGVTDVSADGATKQNKFDYTYELHFFDEGVENAADNYWTWQLGNKANAANYGGYMPTFNKNKDSLAVDQNGSYTAAIGGIIDREENYDMSEDSGFVAYAADEEKTANAIYDNDGNDADELAALSAADLKDIIENGDRSDKWNGDYANAVHLENETHTARAIPETKGVISMEAWLELDAAEQGNYWVYDTDGWVYWSSAIKPGSATGPLLEGFALDHEMDDTWYYAINVVAQFVTADDLGKDDNTGFYDESGWYDPTGLGEEKEAKFEGAGQAPTENALKLLEKIGVQTKEEDDMPTLEMLDYASNTMSSTVAYISVEPGEAFRVKNTDGNMASEEYLTVCTRGGFSLEKGTDYTYENGLLTITAPEGATWLNENGTALQVMCNDLDTEASGIGYIVYDDDGALTLNTDSSSEHGPDITVVPLGSSVTVLGANGAKSYVLQVGYEYAPLSAASGYNSTTGVWTITNEEWVGKIIKVLGDTTHVEGYGFVVVAPAESGSGSDDSDVPDTDYKLDLKATETSSNIVSFVSVETGDTILLDNGKDSGDYTIEWLKINPDNGRSADVTLEKDTDYTLENGVLTIKENNDMSGGSVLRVKNADSTKNGYIVVNDDGEINCTGGGQAVVDGTVIHKGSKVTFTNNTKGKIGFSATYSATADTEYTFSDNVFEWLIDGDEGRLLLAQTEGPQGYLFVAAADEDSDSDDSSAEGCFFTVTDNDGDYSNDPTMEKSPTMGYVVSYEGTATEFTFAPADGSSGWTYAFDNGENYSSTSSDGVTTITSSGEKIATLNETTGVLTLDKGKTIGGYAQISAAKGDVVNKITLGEIKNTSEVETEPKEVAFSASTAGFAEISLTDTVNFKNGSQTVTELGSVKVKAVDDGGTDTGVALTEETDYTFQNGQFKLKSGGKVSGGDVIEVYDGAEGTAYLFVEPNTSLTLMRKTDVEDGQPAKQQVVSATVGTAAVVEFSDNSVPTTIKSISAIRPNETVSIGSGDYDYQNGQITFKNSSHANCSIRLQAEDASGNVGYGFIYLTAAE